jgi:hypothetical protein
MKKTVYLVVRADGDVRAAKRPRIAADEVAIPVILDFPPGWGRTLDAITITMPEPPKVDHVEEPV